MLRSATIASPLRSKRAMISPDRPRAKASGFTRINVRCIGVPLVGGRSAAWARPAGRARAARRLGGRDRRRARVLLIGLLLDVGGAVGRSDRLALAVLARGLRARRLRPPGREL